MKASTSILALAASLTASSAYAQSSGADGLERSGLSEIVVTAQRRAQNMQDVPVTVSAVSAETLAKQGTNSVIDLPQAFPGVNIGRAATVMQPFLRGVGNAAIQPGNDPSVATYIDGVYQANPQSMLFSFNNIARIEVLKGPQGTLFGRNATGGAIQIVTKDPSATPEARFKVGYGRFNALTTSAYVSGGSDKIAADLSVIYNKQWDGWGKNLFPGGTFTLRGQPVVFPAEPNTAGPLEETALRSKVVIKPTEDLTIKLVGYYSWSSGNQSTYRHLIPGAISSNGWVETGGWWDYTGYLATTARSRTYGGSAEIAYDLGFATFKSISAYDNSRGQFKIASAPNPFPNVPTAGDSNADTVHTGKTFTQELQLLSAPGSSVDWIAGLYYYQLRGAYDPLTFFIGDRYVDTFKRYSRGFNRSYAAFAQATVPLGAATRFTGGLRYTWDKLEMSAYDVGTDPAAVSGTVTFPGAISQIVPLQSASNGKLTWRASLDHHFTPDVMAFASVNYGYKAGAWNLSGPCNRSPAALGNCPVGFIAPSVKPETLLSYEGGIKSELFDRRLRLNVSAFYYKYKNLQVTLNKLVILPDGSTSFQTVIDNAAEASLYGLDADMTAALSDNFTLTAGLLLEHTQYDSYPNAQIFVPNATAQNPTAGGDATVNNYNAAGKKLSRAPEVTLNLAADYVIPTSIGKFNLNASWYHNGGFYWEPSNRLKQKAYDLLNATVSLTLPDEHWKVSLWAKNIGNTKYHTYVQPSGRGDVGVVGAPATYGATVEWKM